MYRLLLSLILLPVLIQALPFGQTGFLESSITYNLDTLSASGSSLIHQERVAWGVQGSNNSFWNLNYRIMLGGALRGNSSFPINQFTPEYGLHTKLQPSPKIDLALFSYSRLRNPMQVFSDSLEYQEFVHGLKLGAQFSPNSRFSMATGIRSQQISHRDSFTSNQQFVQLQLDKRLAGMQFRVAGEGDIWARDTSDNRHLSTASIRWSGSPLKALNWTAVNAFYVADDYNFWRIAHRINYDISRRQSLWMVYSLGDFAYGSQNLIRQNHDLRYRFQWKPVLGLEVVFKGNKITIPDSLDIFHWRSYGLSANWSGGRKNFFRGNLDAGFKESYRYGKGMDILLYAAESRQLINSGLIALQVRDDLNAEFFQRFDETADLRYDIQHKVRLTTTLLPENRHQLGNHLKLHSHFGSDLDFSADTLRNAIIDEVYYKTFRQTSQFTIYYRTVLDIQDPESDLQFSLNTRFYKRISQSVSTNFMTMYRFKSDKYADYLWLSGVLKFQTELFNCALELQSAGHPDMAFKQDSRIWLRLLRQI
ncbi:hypothetical protein HQ531_01825 [bacterium]|nr:hypothetical protein [bacterium]